MNPTVSSKRTTVNAYQSTHSQTKTSRGLPTSPASKVPKIVQTISTKVTQTFSETKFSSTKLVTSSKSTTLPIGSSSVLSSQSIQKNEKSSTTTFSSVEMNDQTLFSPEVRPTSATPLFTMEFQSTNILETEELLRVTRTLGVELGMNDSTLKTKQTWFQAIWHIEILAIVGSGWFLGIFFMFCGLSVCICKCKTKYNLRMKYEKAEEERKKAMKAYHDAENSNREWLQRIFESKKQEPKKTEIEMKSHSVQTEQPKLPTMPKPDLSRIPTRGILKMNPKSNTFCLNQRFVKENQGVRAKEFKPRTGSIEIPIEKLGTGPKLNEVRFAKEMTVHIIEAMDNGFVFNKNLSHLVKVDDGYSPDYDVTDVEQHTTL